MSRPPPPSPLAKEGHPSPPSLIQERQIRLKIEESLERGTPPPPPLAKEGHPLPPARLAEIVKSEKKLKGGPP
jgi:hypothetical protein